MKWKQLKAPERVGGENRTVILSKESEVNTEERGKNVYITDKRRSLNWASKWKSMKNGWKQESTQKQAHR